MASGTVVSSGSFCDTRWEGNIDRRLISDRSESTLFQCFKWVPKSSVKSNLSYDDVAR